MASPHTRGWTRGHLMEEVAIQGFPAHAGMDPCRASAWRALPGLPRTRGDGPMAVRHWPVQMAASPHTRGWTPFDVVVHVRVEGFPAHAGMDPQKGTPKRVHPRLPRTRGDGPSGTPATAPSSAASPHTRGWTLSRHGEAGPEPGFPAHAGMDPLKTCW